jgi:hypothetical protein
MDEGWWLGVLWTGGISDQDKAKSRVGSGQVRSSPSESPPRLRRRRAGSRTAPHITHTSQTSRISHPIHPPPTTVYRGKPHPHPHPQQQTPHNLSRLFLRTKYLSSFAASLSCSTSWSTEATAFADHTFHVDVCTVTPQSKQPQP